jgi:hypothetical protein
MYFLHLLEECVTITVPFQQRRIDNMQQDYVDPETDVLICQYILDANFDNLRPTALLDLCSVSLLTFTAKLECICTNVKKFIDEHV